MYLFLAKSPIFLASWHTCSRLAGHWLSIALSSDRHPIFSSEVNINETQIRITSRSTKLEQDTNQAVLSARRRSLRPELVTAEAHDAEQPDSARHLRAWRELDRVDAEAALSGPTAAGAEAGGTTFVIVPDTHFAFLGAVATEQLLA